MPFNLWRPNSIRARMTAGFALFIAALMLGVCAAFFATTKRADRQSADARLDLAAQEIKRELSDDKSRLDNPAEFLREENDEWRAADLAVLIVDKRGRVVAQSQREAPPWPLRGDAWRTRQFRAGAMTVVVGVEWSETEAALRERTLLLLALSTLVVALSSLGAWVLVGRTLSPIDRLARGAKEASIQTLRVRLDAPSRDAEIVRLVDTLNDLLARLAQTAAARGRFYAAASHELRTPLQALSGHLEVALSRPREAAEYEIALDEARAQTERLTSLVQDLLLLNQLDADTSRPPGTLLDVAEICVNELAPLRALAAERELSIELDLPDACEMLAPWNHMTMLLRNLLENAVKYATPGGSVDIALRGSTLTIANDCERVEGWNADKYFEPFFRPDAARHSSTGGNGLGLAICKAIADSNDWKLNLEQRDDGLCARVDFRDN